MEVLREPGAVFGAFRRAVPDLCCGELTELAFSCVNAFCDAMETRQIRNLKGYMKSVIWNAFAELPVNRGSF